MFDQRKIWWKFGQLAALLAVCFVAPMARAGTVATITGCYDCGVFDTPSLIFNNTSGGCIHQRPDGADRLPGRQ